MAHDLSGSVCVVLDILRATSSIVTMFARGAEEVIVAASIEDARRLAAKGDDLLLCGEQGGLPPPDFHYGNSPRQFASLSLDGQRVVLATSNGTRALVLAADSGASSVLVGSLLNLNAVASASLQAAIRGGHNIWLVCAGERYGTAFSLEDAYGAGALAERIVRLHKRLEDTPRLAFGDGAVAARRLAQSFHGRAKAALRLAEHGEYLRRLGFGHDLAFCARVDAYDVVPRPFKAADSWLILRAGP